MNPVSRIVYYRPAWGSTEEPHKERVLFRRKLPIPPVPAKWPVHDEIVSPLPDPGWGRS